MIPTTTDSKLSIRDFERISKTTQQQVAPERIEIRNMINNDNNRTMNRINLIKSINSTIDNEGEKLDISQEQNYISQQETKNLGKSKGQKPHLVLHVGPQKTATTTIQLGVLGEDHFIKMFEKDMYKIIKFGWKDMEKLSREFLERLPSGAQNTTLWEDLISMYDKAYDEGKHVIHSNEYFSFMPRTKEVKDLFKKLQEKWDVHIIVVYRPLETWLPSMYNEVRTKAMFSKQTSNWRSFYKSGLNKYKTTMPVWYKEYSEYLVGKMGDPLGSDSLGTKDFFEELFGKEKMHILELESPDSFDITIRFVCQGIPDAVNVCSKMKSMFRRPQRRNTISLLKDQDLIAVKVWKTLSENPRISVGGKEYFCELPHRREATLRIDEKMSKEGLNEKNMPRLCLSKKQLKVIKERSWRSEQAMSSNPRTMENIEEELKKLYLSKYCSVDADAIIRDPKWLNFFKSREYLENCHTSS